MKGLLVGGTENFFKAVTECRPLGHRLYTEHIVSEDAGKPASFEVTVLDAEMEVVSIQARQGQTHITAVLTKELLEEALRVLN